MVSSGYSHSSPETKKSIQDDRTNIFNQINAHASVAIGTASAYSLE